MNELFERLFKGEARRGSDPDPDFEQPDPATAATPSPPIPSVEYNPAKTYTRSSDRQGHRDYLRVPIPRDLSAIVHRAVQTLPTFESPQDLVRDALVHRLQWLANHHDMLDIAEDLRKQTLAAEVERVQVGIAADSEYVNECKRSLDAAIQAGDDAAVSVLAMSMGEMRGHVGVRHAEELDDLARRARDWLGGR